MIDRRCPEEVKHTLESLSPTITIEPQLFSTSHPELKLTYTPTQPGFTIRHILSTISSVNESFQVTLVKEAMIEKRAEALRQLLKRLVMSFVISIPTFIIGVLLMSLLPSRS